MYKQWSEVSEHVHPCSTGVPSIFMLQVLCRVMFTGLIYKTLYCLWYPNFAACTWDGIIVFHTAGSIWVPASSKQVYSPKNIMTILIQDANKAMAGYQKEILPSSWSPIVKYTCSVYNINKWRERSGAPAGFQARVGKIRREAPKKIFVCPPWFSVCPPCHT